VNYVESVLRKRPRVAITQSWLFDKVTKTLFPVI